MRHLKDLSPDEQNAYRVWQSKLKDRTLSAAQHDECRREIDNLLWKGPNAKLNRLETELAVIRDRLSRIEFHLGLDDTVAPPAAAVDGYINASVANQRIIDDETTKAISAEIKKVVRADCGNSITLKDSATSAEDFANHGTQPQKDAPSPLGNRPSRAARGREAGDPGAPSEIDDNKPTEPETRGRKKLRWHPEKDANKKWHVLDRETGEFTDHGPYKTRRECKEMCDTLNNMPNRPSVSTPMQRDAEASVALDKDPDCGTHCVEEMPDGAPIGEVISRVGDPDGAQDIVQNASTKEEMEGDSEDPLAFLGD